MRTLAALRTSADHLAVRQDQIVVSDVVNLSKTGNFKSAGIVKMVECLFCFRRVSSWNKSGVVDDDALWSDGIEERSNVDLVEAGDAGRHRASPEQPRSVDCMAIEPLSLLAIDVYQSLGNRHSLNRIAGCGVSKYVCTGRNLVENGGVGNAGGCEHSTLQIESTMDELAASAIAQNK